jgi:hypothetical protein
MKAAPNGIIDALRLLQLDGDAIFRRIRDDLDRGLINEARGHLNFVDELMQAQGREREENARLRKWIEELDQLTANEGAHREWPGDMGWVYPGAAVYYSGSKREEVLSNAQGDSQPPTKD